MKYEELPDDRRWKADIMLKVLESNCSKGALLRASILLDRSEKTVKRYAASIKDGDFRILLHGNTGKSPATRIPDATREKITKIYTESFSDANFAHFREILEEEYEIKVSEGSLENILKKEGLIYSPKANRSTKREYNKKQKELEKNPNLSEEEKTKYDRAKYLIDHYEFGARRSRSKYFGEMIQMDASQLKWNGKDVWHLHLAVDDATGEVVGARFEPQETLRGYFHVLKQILENYGIPLLFRTDKRTCFEKATHTPRTSYAGRVKNSSAFNEVDDVGSTLTQFRAVLAELGCELRADSEPLFKPRVERMNQSFQSRLPVDLRRKGIVDIEEANAYLPEFVSRYNSKFSCKSEKDIKDNVFEECKFTEEEYTLMLSSKTDKRISRSAIKFDNSYWALYDKNGKRAYFRDKTPCVMLEVLTGEYIVNVEGNLYGLKEIADRKLSSELEEGQEKDTELETPSKPPYVPRKQPSSHPWKKSYKNREG